MVESYTLFLCRNTDIIRAIVRLMNKGVGRKIPEGASENAKTEK